MQDASRRRSHRPHGTEQAFEMVSRRVSRERLIEIARRSMPTRRFLVWHAFYIDGWTILHITHYLRGEGYRVSARTCARERLAADAYLLDRIECDENPGEIGTFVEVGGVLRFKPDTVVNCVVRAMRGGFVQNPRGLPSTP